MPERSWLQPGAAAWWACPPIWNAPGSGGVRRVRVGWEIRGEGLFQISYGERIQPTVPATELFKTRRKAELALAMQVLANV